jgi:hypothetical protein
MRNHEWMRKWIRPYLQNFDSFVIMCGSDHLYMDGKYGTKEGIIDFFESLKNYEV